MAFEYPFTSKDDVDHPKSYGAIHRVTLYNPKRKLLIFEIVFFKDKAARTNGKSYIGAEIHSFTPNEADFDNSFINGVSLDNIYDYVMTLLTPFDFAQNAISSVTTAQRDQKTDWDDNVIIYNETTTQYEQYNIETEDWSQYTP